MKTKGLVAILALLLAWAAPASAGQTEGIQQNLEQVRQKLEEIKKRLNLTSEQIEQVRPMLIEEVLKLKAVQENYKGGDQNLRTRLQAGRELRDIQTSTDEKLRKILSKKQMEEMKKIREEWRQQLRDRVQK